MLNILFEDGSIAVIEKPAGLSSENTPDSNGAPDLLKAQLSSAIYTVHRLDIRTGGVMIYAKTKQAAAKLGEEINQNIFTKEYIAITDGVPETDSGEYRDLLYRDKRQGKTYIVKRMRSGVKDAKLSYNVIRKNNEHALVKVKLYTGRTHQIRVQFASRKTPVTGDGKYGSRTNSPTIALWSHRLKFLHPVTGNEMEFTSEPDYGIKPWNLI